jgi:predicted component of type VI protein secretion system
MTIRRFAHPLAIALSVGAINYAFLPRAFRSTPQTPTMQVAELAIVAAYLEVAASHWRGLTLGTDDRPSED